MLDGLWTDLRLAVRSLRQSPGFSTVVALTFALAIGANTTVFSLLNAALLRDAPVRRPAGLVSIEVTDARTKQRRLIPRDTFTAFAAAARSLSGLSMYGGRALRVQARGAFRDVVTEEVTPGYFGLLDVKPEAGRLLAESDDTPASAPAVVISDRLWRDLFGGDPRAVTETLTVDGEAMAIVGVAEEGFFGLQMDSGADVFIPVATVGAVVGGARPPARERAIVGRLAPGVTLAEAQAEVGGRWTAIARSTAPAAERDATATERVSVQSLRGGFFGVRDQYGPSIVVLVGLAAMLLVMGCVNLASLVLARATARRQQTAVRLALGASRSRLVQQMLVEGLLLAAAGLALALPLAWRASGALAAAFSVARIEPFLRPLTPDVRVLLASAVVTIGAGVGIGLLPAWRSASVSLDSALRPGRALAGSLGRAGRLLLVAQAAIALVLLVGAGLFAGTLASLRANDGAAHPAPILFTKPWRNPGDRVALGRAYWEALTRRLSQIPGAGRASLSTHYPAFLGYRGTLPVDTYASASRDAGAASGLTELVSPGFFATYGIARLRGRDFTWDDDAGASKVAILDASAARALFPGGDAVGARIRIWSGSTTTEAAVVGVVADTAIGSLREPHQPVVFRPILQEPVKGAYPLVHLQVSGDVRSAREAYVRVVESMGHHYIPGLFSFDEWIGFALLQERLIAATAVAAAAIALLLGCLGLYGLLAYAVNARVREIGVRVALGATRRDVIGLVVRDGLTLAIAGVLIGIPCAIAAARLARSQLYGLRPGDPLTIAGAALMFILTALVATAVPARRASKIDPMDALRHE